MEPIPETVRAIEELGPFVAEGELLEALTALSREVERAAPRCVGMSVSSREYGVTFTFVASALQVAFLDAVQFLDGGPCVKSIERGVKVAYTVPEATDEEAWALFARAAAATGIGSTLTLPLITDGVIQGSVNLYGATSDAFDDTHEQMAALFETTADRIVTNADLTFSTRGVAEDAPHILEAESVLDRSAAVVADLQHVDPTTARDRIRTAARRAGISPDQLAEALVSLGG
ncbi:GAF domain-containing protein [Nocardioides lijunqiniae]|uniref:GAF domain-containing protein n=1 Tax=Nocardioides lijunqiniae TaxID=2760832 RepID=UPI001877FA00|nr:GAF domain-containing protein [Nocardioides lijunqiniae]